MDIEFQKTDLEQMAYDSNYTGNWPSSIVRAYRKTVNLIDKAENFQVLGAFRGLRLKKLKGKRKHQYSMRLNDQYRLIVEVAKKNNREVITIINVEDYH